MSDDLLGEDGHVDGPDSQLCWSFPILVLCSLLLLFVGKETMISHN